MQILVIGSEVNLKECRQKFGETNQYQLAENSYEVTNALTGEKVVFDFHVGSRRSRFEFYRNFSGVVFLDVSRSSLEELIGSHEARTTFIGFCGLPTFLNREILEVSLIKKEDEVILNELCVKLHTKFAVVKDQVGLVTSRIICMIINEAYFAIMEKIALRSDIDLAMKLGTNYPFGPFEWSEKIGIRNVYEVLKAVGESTNDERYKVCGLLEKEALMTKL